MTREELIKKMVEEWDYPQTVIDLTEITIPKKDQEILATYSEREKTSDGKIEKLTYYILTDRDFIKIFTYPLKPQIDCGYDVYSLNNFLVIEEKALLDKDGFLDPPYRRDHVKKMEVAIYFNVPDENLRRVIIATREKEGSKEAEKEKCELRVFIDKFREVASALR